MFTLYRIGFCFVSKVAPVQCKQELMLCCGAEIVPKCSQCEQSPIRHTICFDFEKITYSYEVPLQFLLRYKCSDLARAVSKTYPIQNVPLSTATAERHCSGAETASKTAFLKSVPYQTGALSFQ